MMRCCAIRCCAFVMLAAVWVAVAARAAGDEEPKAVLAGLDPVELVAGREVLGLPEIAASRGEHHYLFATEENRRRFQRSPERYAIQLNGACARMGPLSGAGNPDCFFVHDSRIYIFASESCRESFRSNPERFLESGDSPPSGSAADRAAADRLLAQAVEAAGGDEALKKLESIRIRFMINLKYGTGAIEYARDMTLAFPGICRLDEDYGESRWSWLLLPEGGYVPADARRPPVDEPVRSAMARVLYRQPIAILKAWQAEETVAFVAGSGRAGGVAVETVDVAVQGATTRLFIDTGSGRIVQISYRGRSGAGLGEVVKTFTDFREVGALVLPFHFETRFDGDLVENPEVEIESIRVNEAIDPALLSPP